MLGRLHSAATNNSPFRIGGFVSGRSTSISYSPHNFIINSLRRSLFVRHCSEKKKNMESNNSAPVVDAPVKFEKYTGPEAQWYNDTPMEILISKEKGRGLFSSQELKKGDVLLRAIPYAWAVYEPNKKTTCRYCLRDTPGPDYAFFCSECKDVWYCSVKCQMLDRPIHIADECSVLKNWELDPSTYALDTIGEMKFLLRVLSSKCYERSEDYTPREDNLVYADYATLVARRQDFDKTVTDALNYWICDYVSKLRKWLGKSEEPEELLDIVLRNRRNSFYVASTHGKNPAGCAVYITPSFFNHSCKSNVFYQSYPEAHVPRMFEYLSEIDAPKGTELCISYLDDNSIVLNYLKRRALLKESFLFTCTCKRCLTEEAETTKDFIFSDLGDLAEKSKYDNPEFLKKKAAKKADGAPAPPPRDK